MGSWIGRLRAWNRTKTKAVPLRLLRAMGPRPLASSPPRSKTLDRRNFLDVVWAGVAPPIAESRLSGAA
jgi:hypothetical protein